MNAARGQRARRAGTGFIRAMLPGMELGLVVAIFFIVLATQRPATTAGQRAEADRTAARVIEKPARDDAPAGEGKNPAVLRAALGPTGLAHYTLDGRDITLAALRARLAADREPFELAIDARLPYAQFHPLFMAFAEAGVAPLMPDRVGGAGP